MSSTISFVTYTVARLLSDHEICTLSLKLVKMGLDCSITRFGASTVIEVYKPKENVKDG